jgi:hypothetical protein
MKLIRKLENLKQKKYIYLFFLLSFFYQSWSQNNVESKSGTYQIRIDQSFKREFVYTTETLMFFENSRNESEDLILRLNEYAVVFLPSKNAIRSAEFKPLIELIYE